MSAKRRLAPVMAVAALLGGGSAYASTTQILLDENFQDVTGITGATTVRRVSSILTDVPMPLDGSPVASFVNTANGNASANSFNVRRWDNAIDGAGPLAFGDTDFDNFFVGTPNQFLVMGDDTGNLAGVPNGGTSSGASSTMAIRFALDAITLSAPKQLDILFDYVFDANDVLNTDDFIAELILADSSRVNLLSFAAPTAATRGGFSTSIAYSTLAAAPAFLNFRLVEGAGTGSSAVGLDNLSVTAVPEPGILSLLGLSLLGLGLARLKRG